MLNKSAWVVENGQKYGKWEATRLILYNSKDETKNLFSFRQNESPNDEIIILNHEVLHTDPTFLEILSKFGEFSKRQVFHVQQGDFKIKFGSLSVGNEKKGYLIQIEYEACVDITQTEILDEFVMEFKLSTFDFNDKYNQYHLSEDIYSVRHDALQFVLLLQTLNLY